MKEAFVYMFKDTCFIKKASIYAILSFLTFTFFALADINTCSGGCPIAQSPCVLTTIKPATLSYKILGLLCNIFIAGFYLTNLSAVINQNNNIVLPFFNFKTTFLKGIKLYTSVFVTSLAYYVLFSAYIILGFSIEKINLLSILPILIAIPILFYSICYNSFIYEYASTNNFTTFFNFKKAIKNIKECPKNYFKHWGLVFTIFVIGALLTFIFELTFNHINNIYVIMTLSNITSAVIYTYVAYISIYLISKSLIRKENEVCV